MLHHDQDEAHLHGSVSFCTDSQSWYSPGRDHGDERKKKRLEGYCDRIVGCRVLFFYACHNARLSSPDQGSFQSPAIIHNGTSLDDSEAKEDARFTVLTPCLMYTVQRKGNHRHMPLPSVRNSAHQVAWPTMDSQLLCLYSPPPPLRDVWLPITVCFRG